MNSPLPPVAPSATDDTTPPLKLIRRFLPYLWPKNHPDQQLRIVLAILCLIAAKVLGLAVPFAYKHGVDALSAKPEPLLTVALVMMGAYVLGRFMGLLFEQLRNVAYERVGQRSVKLLALEVFTRLHQLSLRYHLERRTGGLSRVIERGVKSIDVMVYFLLFNIAPTIIELLAVCVIFWINFSWELTAATLVFVAIYILFTQRITEWRTKLRREMVDTDTHANARAVDSLLNFETVKYFNNEAHEVAGYNKAITRWEKAAVKSENSIALLNIGQALITNMLMGGALLWVVWQYTLGRFTLGDVVLVQTILAQLFRPLDILGWVYREIKQGLIDMEAMYKVIDTPAEILDAPDAQPLVTRGGTIRFDNVHFGYDPRREILHGVSFEVPAGKTLAIVGPSGAGKSTIARILFRFYDIQSGSVTIDGQDIRQITQDSLRRAIGIVPQDTVLFNETIRYNIGYGKTAASQADIESAADQAQIHDFILRTPDKYDTVVGERGLKLSGGEKQRVAIARTILKDPPILILDEATSALDTATERDIQAELRTVSQNRTTLIVAHRLSTIVEADEIIVLNEGHIVERGTHDSLLLRDGIYARMWNAQLDAMGEADIQKLPA
jgi:ATP-binding cassette, subfamily B, heavy metal transporter